MKFAAERVALALFVLSAGATAQVTARESVTTGGVQASFQSLGPALSADGRWIAFTSAAFNLDPADTNGNFDVYLRDRVSGTTAIASLAWNGAAGDNESGGAVLSADGHSLLFVSAATNLVPNDTNFCYDVFLRDLTTGVLERVNVSSTGVESNYDSYHAPSISADGRFVAFDSLGSTLVPNDFNFRWDVFVRDRQLGTTERVSVSSAGAEGNADSVLGRISADGRWVAFISSASNLVPGDTNSRRDIFVFDRVNKTTERLAIAGPGQQADGDVGEFVITPDFRWVAFDDDATNLVPGDVGLFQDVFLLDRATGTREIVSRSSLGVQGDGGSWYPALSADGRYVAFLSLATNLVTGDTNSAQDVFVRDLATGTTTRVSVSTAGTQAGADSASCVISADGRIVAFDSVATNLVTGDTNNARDVFTHDRGPLATGTDSCLPGVAGVLACPCANPPSGSTSGCNNSSATGGAQLLASGAAALAADTLIFDALGENPNATSILVQGSTYLTAGTTFGQGVRCAGGTLLRMYSQGAAGGATHFPAAGDPSVSSRSAALGDPLGMLALRWYAVYYRDNGVLGGCPVTSNFNCTQTVRVLWMP